MKYPIILSLCKTAIQLAKSLSVSEPTTNSQQFPTHCLEISVSQQGEYLEVRLTLLPSRENSVVSYYSSTSDLEENIQGFITCERVRQIWADEILRLQKHQAYLVDLLKDN